ncbi:hypothetical protein ACFLYU_00110 [Candidatus Dependentiae bacterium]
MRRFICAKLLAVFLVNSLVIPLVNCGKKYYKRKHDKGRNYRRKERRFNYVGRVSKKEKKRISKWQKRVEKLSKANRARNKSLKVKQNEARKEFLKIKQLLGCKRFNGLKESRKNKKSLDDLEAESLFKKLGKLFGLRVPKKLLFFAIFLAILALSSAEEMMGRVRVVHFFFDTVCHCTYMYEFPSGSKSLTCNCRGVYLDPCVDDEYEVTVYTPYTPLSKYAYCRCEYIDGEEMGGLLKCSDIWLDVPEQSSSGLFLESNFGYGKIDLNGQKSVDLSTTASVVNIVTSSLFASGCLIGTIGWLCCLYKKIRENMRLESQKKLKNSSTVTFEEV